MRSSPRAIAVALLVAAAACRTVPPAAAPPAAMWFRGNTHTHTLWSDGDDFPEMVADWYRAHGYHFVSLTDHNTLADEERWWRVPATGIGRAAYEKYRARFGDQVQERRAGDTTWVRLRRPAEYRPRLEQPGGFVFVEGEEITQYLEKRGAHMTALNLAALVPAQPGATLVEMFRRDLQQLDAQARQTGRPVVGVLNHPNFLWSQSAEDLLALDGLRFFEVYNGHPLVYTQGDALHAGNERIWDIVLAHRLARGGALLYGVATDDAHDYHPPAPERRYTGRGWVQVRATMLTPDSLMAAMQRGDFYASTGVTLADVRRDGSTLSLAIRGEPGVTYTTQFIGTRRGFDTTSVAVRDSTGRALTRRYSADVGAVLATVAGTSASYTMRGDELYVRARVVSSRAKADPAYAGELESAWTQPVRPE